MALKGIDISGWNEGINLSVVPADFVIAKATEGTYYVSSDCDRQYQQAKAAGRLLGVYHYASGADAKTEADYFLNHVKDYIGEAILCLDWESGGNSQFGVNDYQWCKTWCDYVYSKTGVKPVVYIQKSAMGNISGIGDYPLWIAQYADMNETGYQDTPWNEGAYACAIRQYSSCGRLNGYSGNLDLNKFYGDKATWNKYARKSETQDTSTPTEDTSNTASGGDAGLVFTYAAQLADGTILPFVTNLNDFAGIQGKEIANIAIQVNKGSVKYRAHVKGGSWLPYVTGCDFKDANNGYAGNGKVIDAVEVYYTTPSDIVNKYGYQKAQYRVSALNSDYYSWQYDDEKTDGQDGYAGCFGVSIDRFQLF